MITLTNPVQVTTVLGSAAKTSYDRLDLITINYDVLNKQISGQCQLIASASPGSAAIFGSYLIPTTGQAIITVTLPTVSFYGSLSLTPAQITTVQGWITGAQNQVEAGLVSVAIIAGTQATGT